LVTPAEGKEGENSAVVLGSGIGNRQCGLKQHNRSPDLQQKYRAAALER
jgi:hypothetical protein